MHLFAKKNSAKPEPWKLYNYVVKNNGINYYGSLGNYIDWFAFFFGGDLLDNIYLPIPLSNLNIDETDLIKDDVEGYEPSVLIGMQRSLRLHRPFVICEMSDSSNRLLEQKGATLASILPDGYLLVDADSLSTKIIDWSFDWLKRYSIPDFYKGNVLCLPDERIGYIS